MISRRRCKCIAREWVSSEGIAEYNRRMDDVGKNQARYGLPYDGKLVKDATEFMLHGFYDPPAPRVPGFFSRLRMSDWTPPERTDPMYTGKPSKLRFGGLPVGEEAEPKNLPGEENSQP